VYIDQGGGGYPPKAVTTVTVVAFYLNPFLPYIKVLPVAFTNFLRATSSRLSYYSSP
jgi:hypothetical protein